MKRRNFNVPLYGNAAERVGQDFEVSSKFLDHQFFSKTGSSPLTKGKVHHIVAHKSWPGVLWFAYYDAMKHTIPPSLSSNEWYYGRCALLLSQNKSKQMVMWRNSLRGGEVLIGRSVSKFFPREGRYYSGKVKKMVRGRKISFDVVYEDGDKFSYTEKEILAMLRVDLD